MDSLACAHEFGDLCDNSFLCWFLGSVDCKNVWVWLWRFNHDSANKCSEVDDMNCGYKIVARSNNWQGFRVLYPCLLEMIVK